jgi:DNA-binding transcriptional LysR family regulator
MDLDSLRCFDAAATAMNFRAAAARVHLSPAAFSDRLQRLEGDLGARLFLRTTRRVALSDAGRRLLPLARSLLAGAEEMRARARGPAVPAPFELVVGTRYELGLSWLCPGLTPLARRRPERTIHLYNGDTPDLLLRLERGDLDAVVASMRLTSPQLTYAALHAEEYALVGTERTVRRRDDARAATLVDVSRDLPLFRYFLDALPDAEPWPFARVEFLGGIANIRRRLLDGEGRVAVLPRYFIRADLAEGRLLRLAPRVRLRSDAFRLVWRTDHPRTADLLALAEELRALPLR